MRLIGLAVILSLILAPLAAEAKQARKVYKIGYLAASPPAAPGLPSASLGAKSPFRQEFSDMMRTSLYSAICEG